MIKPPVDLSESNIDVFEKKSISALLLMNPAMKGTTAVAELNEIVKILEL